MTPSPTRNLLLFPALYLRLRHSINAVFLASIRFPPSSFHQHQYYHNHTPSTRSVTPRIGKSRDLTSTQPTYREARSLMTQNIPYPLGFVLASAFGPGHSALAKMRDALSKAWGSEIPSNGIFYPSCNSSSREFELIGMGPKRNAAASPAVKTSPIITSTTPVDLTSPGRNPSYRQSRLGESSRIQQYT